MKLTCITAQVMYAHAQTHLIYDIVSLNNLG